MTIIMVINIVNFCKKKKKHFWHQPTHNNHIEQLLHCEEIIYAKVWSSSLKSDVSEPEKSINLSTDIL